MVGWGQKKSLSPGFAFAWLFSHGRFRSGRFRAVAFGRFAFARSFSLGRCRQVEIVKRSSCPVNRRLNRALVTLAPWRQSPDEPSYIARLKPPMQFGPFTEAHQEIVQQHFQAFLGSAAAPQPGFTPHPSVLRIKCTRMRIHRSGQMILVTTLSE